MYEWVEKERCGDGGESGHQEEEESQGKEKKRVEGNGSRMGKCGRRVNRRGNELQDKWMKGRKTVRI